VLHKNTCLACTERSKIKPQPMGLTPPIASPRSKSYSRSTFTTSPNQIHVELLTRPVRSYGSRDRSTTVLCKRSTDCGILTASADYNTYNVAPRILAKDAPCSLPSTSTIYPAPFFCTSVATVSQIPAPNVINCCSLDPPMAVAPVLLAAAARQAGSEMLL
jgi:hypothetical protein